MSVNPELVGEAEQRSRIEELIPRWREVPLYREVLAQKNGHRVDFDDFQRLPLIAKPEMRQNFPQNFLPTGQSIETLVEQNLIELEHTSGTSSERLPVIFARGWWNAQEERALRLNSFVAKVLDEHPRRPPRHHHVAIVQRPNLSDGLDVTRTTYHWQCAVRESRADSIPD